MQKSNNKIHQNHQTIKGDLIKLALDGQFDIIVHGCNCFSTQKSGIAKQMVENFTTDTFDMETSHYLPIDKLGNIDYSYYGYNLLLDETYNELQRTRLINKELCIINAYTQYYYGKKPKESYWFPLDYDALRLCFRKINHTREFFNKHIGIPYIGAGLAGGDWSRIKEIILEELYNLKITFVEYEKN